MNFVNDSQSYGLQSLALLDEEFLATLSEQKERDIYARVIALDINENPIDQIEGRVTGGSINIDGTSSIRRTCSLTMISEKIDINDFYWGIKTKFKLEIGLRNQLTGTYAPGQDSVYPEIVWFQQGYYVVSSFNTSISTNTCTVSLSGKDKMCLLSGDLGGQLYASIDFGTEEIKTKIMEPISIENIISSENITLKKYYIKSVYQANQSPKRIIDAAVIEESEKQYPLYVFIAIDKNKDNIELGSYYKKGNTYYLVETNADKQYIQYKYYTMYKLVQKPEEELFTPVSPSFIYQPDTYYYEKFNQKGYFILDSATEKNNSRQYYELVQLYEKYENITKKQIPIEKIIREAIHTYAKEPYHNIIINDLDEYGLEQLTYKGEDNLYLLYNTNRDQFTQLFLEGSNTNLENIINNWQESDFQTLITSLSLAPGKTITLNNKTFSEGGNFGDKNVYTVAKITYGTDIGYRLTELTYTGDLITNIGDSITTVLDKIKAMLGDFEYFYDINGHFIFQRKKTYVETSWNQLMNNQDELYVNYANDKQKFSFNFEGNRLISAIQNQPALNNLKNDFIVWGKRKGVSGQDIPIHGRYAIDKKPVFYKNLSGKIYTTDIQYAIDQNVISSTEYFNRQKLSEEISNFTLLQYYPSGLTKPQKQVKNGIVTWDAGWWHISDWARYYQLLTNSTQPPLGTMKFYSSGDEDGCVQLKTLNNLSYYQQHPISNEDQRAVWLIEINKTTNAVNLQHGSGVCDETDLFQCIYYEDVINDNGEKITSTRTNIKKYFPKPYSGCSDTHTYLYFSNKMEKDNVDIYFYNPHFPDGKTAEELVYQKTTQDFIDWLQKNNNIFIVDWREIIYQMALDFFAGQGCSAEEPLYIKSLTEQEKINNVLQWEDNAHTIPKMKWVAMKDPDHFLYEVGKRNPYYYPTGYTGYEQYYTDLQGFWRQLYDPEYVPEPIYSNGYYEDQKNTLGNGYYSKEKQWIEPQLQDYNIEYFISSTRQEIQDQQSQLNDIINTSSNPEYTLSLTSVLKRYNSYVIDPTDKQNNRLYWNRQVYEQPETLNFWFDFLDSDLELAQFSVRQVGDRTKVVHEDKAGAIIYTDIPNFILYDDKITETYTETDENGNEVTYTAEVCDKSKLRREITDKSGYTFIFLPKGLSQYFTISYRNESVKSKIDTLLYQHGYCTENISITSIPIYYLQPNTRIFVQDKETGINGEYLIDKITLPLTYNGTMSITAVKAPERLY